MARTPHNDPEAEKLYSDNEVQKKSYSSSDLTSEFNSNAKSYGIMSAGSSSEVDENMLDLKGENASYKDWRR